MRVQGMKFVHPAAVGGKPDEPVPFEQAVYLGMRRREDGCPVRQAVDAESVFGDGAGVDILSYPDGFDGLQAGRSEDFIVRSAAVRGHQHDGDAAVFVLTYGCHDGLVLAGGGVEQTAFGRECPHGSAVLDVSQLRPGLERQQGGTTVLGPYQPAVEKVVCEAGRLVCEGPHRFHAAGGVDAYEFAGPVQAGVQGVEAVIPEGERGVGVVETPRTDEVPALEERGPCAVGDRPFGTEGFLDGVEAGVEILLVLAALGDGLLQHVEGEDARVGVLEVSAREEGVAEGGAHACDEHISAAVMVRGVSLLRTVTPLPEVPVEIVRKGHVDILQKVGGAPAPAVCEGGFGGHCISFEQGGPGIDG